jgi:hypothetical protein
MYHSRLVDQYFSLRAKIVRLLQSRQWLQWDMYIAGMGETRNAYKILVGKYLGKCPFGRPRRRWEDNTKMNVGRYVLSLVQIHVQWWALVLVVLNFLVIQSQC